MARIVVAGWVTGLPTASFFWHAASFAVGFRDAGHDVWFLEDSGDEPWLYDPRTGGPDPTGGYGARFLEAEMSRIGMAGRWAFRHVPTGRYYGMGRERTLDVLSSAEVLVNVSLTTPIRPEYLRIPHRLGVDTDPVFTQIRIAKGDALLAPVPQTHTRLFTYGRPPLPAQRHEWLPLRQPVVSRCWPVLQHPGLGAPVTTITTWQAYPSQTWRGTTYATKEPSIRALLDLPTRTPWRLAVALGAGQRQQEGADLLRRNGWELTDPMAANGTTETFQRYLASSAAEIGLAKHGYVVSRCGWFSERTCCYLASGRPAVVADTGWREWLPEGDGVFAYRDCTSAARALDRIRADPERHSRAARKIVEEHFEAAEVCSAMLGAL